MNNIAIHETCLFKLVILVAGIVVGVFFTTALVALLFMPNQLMMSTLIEDISFLVPMILATLCSATILAFYARSYRSKDKN